MDNRGDWIMRAAVESKAISALVNVLLTVSANAPKFSGAGIILYRKASNLPITPLNSSYQPLDLPITGWARSTLSLTTICSTDSVYHDGFHCLSEDGTLTHVSQYFSPPIARGLLNLEHEVGARHRAAQYGSLLQDVIAIGVSSVDTSPVVFVNGNREVLGDRS